MLQFSSKNPEGNSSPFPQKFIIFPNFTYFRVRNVSESKDPVISKALHHINHPSKVNYNQARLSDLIKEQNIDQL